MQITPINSIEKSSKNPIVKRNDSSSVGFGSIVKNEIAKVLRVDEKGIADKFLCIVSGPSGAGKDSILAGFHEKYNFFSRIINCTTRKPRVGEVHGVNYNFLSADEFQRGVQNDEFIEYVNVYGDLFYGTRRSDAEKVLSQGKNALLQLDVDGAMKVKQMFPEALTLFVKPPSVEDLYNRLVNRGTETMDSIKERVAKACYELQFKDEYDVILQNDVLAESIRELAQIFKLEK